MWVIYEYVTFIPHKFSFKPNTIPPPSFTHTLFISVSCAQEEDQTETMGHFGHDAADFNEPVMQIL